MLVDVKGRPVLQLVYIVIGFCFVITLCGLFFGWSTLVLVFQQEGVYSELCNSTHIVVPNQAPTGVNGTNMDSPPLFDSREMCPDQELRFAFVFNVALLGNFLPAPISGWIIDTYGARIGNAIGSGFVILGLLFSAFGYHTAHLDLLIPGMTCLCIGGFCLFISLMSLAQLQPQYLSIVLALYNVAFDSSPIIFYIYVKVYQVFPISPQSFFLFLCIVPLLCIVLSLIWPRGVGEPKSAPSTSSTTSTTTEHSLELETLQEDTDSKANGLHSNENSSNGSTIDSTTLKSGENTVNGLDLHDSNQVKLDIDPPPANSPMPSLESNEKPTTPELTSELGPTNLYNLPFKEQLFKPISIALGSFHITYTYWLCTYMASIQSRLISIDPIAATNPEIMAQIVTYTETFGLILSLAFLISPIVGYTIYRVKLVGAVYINVILGILWSACKFIPNLKFQLVAFVIFATLRAWYYSIIFNIIVQIFGWDNVGKLFGTYSVIAGIISLSFYGISWSVLNLWNGSYLPANIVEFVMIASTLAFAILLHLRRRNYEQSLISTSLRS